MAHINRPDDISSRCIVPTFLSGRVIWHMTANIVHIFVPKHIAACFCISLWCLQDHQNVRPSTGTAEWNHSYYTGNSLSATRFPRLCIHWSPPRRLTALRPQALRSVHNYHTAPSSHLFLRAPLATSHVKQCQLRSPRPSRSSHFLSSHSAATS